MSIFKVLLPIGLAFTAFADPYQDQGEALQNLLFDKPLSMAPELQFAKIGIGFASPVKSAHQVSVQSCGNEFHDGVEFFVQPGTRRFYAEGGAASATVKFAAQDVGEIQSIAINFRHNRDVCIKSITFLSAQGTVIPLKIAKFSASDKGIQAKDAEKTRASFTSAGLDSIVDHELVPRSDDEAWNFRFRGDGTFFIFGLSDEERGGGKFSALGNFTIESADKKTVRLLLKGERFVTPGPWDGWYCGSICGDKPMTGAVPVTDTLVLEKIENNGYVVRNRANPKSRSLPFSDVRVRPSTM